jgi:hypothetical protein
VAGQGTWEAVLQPRDLNSDGVIDAWFDTSSHLTWAAQADPLGATTWATTQAWVAALDLYGVAGWRLPSLQAAAGGLPSCPAYTYDGSGDCGYNVNPARSELAHMFQVVLGNTPWLDSAMAPNPPGWGLSNTGPFVNLREGDYPTSLTSDFVQPDGSTTALVWLFETTYGYQDQGVATDATFHAWAVHDGDIAAAVPEPATWGSLLAGLAAVGGLARRRARDWRCTKMPRRSARTDPGDTP